MNIKNISNEFDVLHKIINGPNYSLFFHVFLIDLDKGVPFSVKYLEDFYPSCRIEGELIKNSFFKAKDLIENYLSFCSTEEGSRLPGEDFPRASSSLLNQRVNTFWNLIKENITIPPESTFEYRPAPGTLFDDCLYWGFSYTFMNSSQALFINVEASD